MPTQNTPQKFENFPLTPQKYRRDQRMPTGLTPQKRLLSHPSEKLIRRGGVDIKWNGPKWKLRGNEGRIFEKIETTYTYETTYIISSSKICRCVDRNSAKILQSGAQSMS